MSAKKTASPTGRSELKRRSPRGQAMVEYSVVTHFLLIGGALALMPVMSILYNSLSKYYESIFFVLSTGAV
jgi:hypothetical protein